MDKPDTAVSRPAGGDHAQRSTSEDGPGGGRVLLLAGAALLGVLAGIGALVSWLAGGTIEVGENTMVNAPGIVHANNSPSAVVNPTDPDNVVVTHRVDTPEFSAGLAWSRDGGRSWESTALPLPEGRDRPFAPDAAFAPDGTLYVTYVNLTGAGNTPQTLWLVRSEDGGHTVSEPVEVAGELAFQARVATGPDGTVHLTWLQAEEVALLSLPQPAPIVAARSTDGGRTFTEPVRVSDPGRERVGAATPVVDSTGRLLVVYVDYKGNVRDFENLEGPAWDEPAGLVVTSSDDGAAFEEGNEFDSEVLLLDRFLVFLPEFPSVAVGPDDALAVAWADGRNGDEDVFLRRSTNGGESWTEPARVNDNEQADGTDQYLPAVSVAPTGRIDVAFLDRRADPDNVMTEAYMAWSSDAGRSFRNFRVSAAAFDSRTGLQVADHLPPDFGTRIGLVSWRDAALPVWTDTRLGSPDTNRQDIVAARVAYPATNPLLSPWLLLALAVVAVGLLAAARSAGAGGTRQEAADTTAQG